MSWIKASSVVFLLTVSVCFGDRVEFIPGGPTQAELTMTSLPSKDTVIPMQGEFILPALERHSTSDGFSEILVSGLHTLGQVGKPALPSAGTLIAVPEGYRASVKILDLQQTQVTGTWVAPVQKKVRCDCELNRGFAFDANLYQTEHLFPSKVIELQSLGYLQSLKFARVAIHPVQFNPREKSLTVTYRLKFQVDFVLEQPKIHQELPKTLFGLAQNLASNGKTLGTTVSPQLEAEKLLIVSPNKFQSALSELIQWKVQKGFLVEWVSFEEAGGTKEALKTYIQNYYDSQSLKPTYLLLVGNAESLPPFMEKTTTGGEEQLAASDYPYTLLSGNDPIPDILYGRLLADDEEEIKLQVSRWIDYEKTPEQASWYSEGMVIASDEKGSGLSDKEYVSSIAENLKKYSYKNIDAFFQEDKTATTANISKAVMDGKSWITYMGHGSGLSWASTNDHFDVNAVGSLSNTRLPFILDVSCANADYTRHPTPFAKAWVTHHSDNKNSGAVAYYGGSVNISWDPPAIMAVGISKAHFEKPIHNLGGTVLAGQIYLSEQKGVGEDVIDNLRWYQLLGDPSLELRTDRPSEIHVSKQIKRNSSKTALEVEVTNADNKPVSSALVSVSGNEEGKPLAFGKTNSRGQITLNFKNRDKIKASLLTVSGYNLETSISQLEP